MVTNKKGVLYLGGRLQVDKVVSQREAERLLSDHNLWKADYHAIAREPIASFDADRVVPLSLTKQLQFVNGSVLKFKSENVLDEQSLFSRSIAIFRKAFGYLLTVRFLLVTLQFLSLQSVATVCLNLGFSPT